MLPVYRVNGLVVVAVVIPLNDALSLEGQEVSRKKARLMSLSLQCNMSGEYVVGAITWVSSAALNKPLNTSVSQMMRTVQRRGNYVVSIS